MNGGRLSRDELLEVASDYLEVELASTEASSRPVAIILAGQSGAGKSSVGTELMEQMQSKGGFIRVDADAMRNRLPYFEDVPQDSPNVPPTLRADAEALAQAVRQGAIASQRNVMVEGPLSDPEAALKLANEFRGAGYRVELHALAVNEQISFERASFRHESDRSAGIYGRFVPREWHDRAYHGMADSVKSLEYRAAVDSVTVYNRLGDPIHEQSPVQGQTTAATALVRARSQLTTYERINLVERWDEIAESMDRRSASHTERAGISLAMERAHYTLRTSPEASAAYDHEYPHQRHYSQEMADTYGQRLEQAYRDHALDRVRDMPELANAFAANAAIRTWVKENPKMQSPAVANKVQEDVHARIATSLREGTPLKEVGVRDGVVSVRDQTVSAELDH